MSNEIEYIRGYTGVVLVANFEAVVFKFHYEGEPACAIAVAEVCFNEECGIRNLYTNDSYNSYDLVYFDAIYEDTTELPEVWKVGAAWTTRKPKEEEHVLDIYEDEEEILRLYDDCLKHECLLEGDSGIPEKDLENEKETIEYLLGELRRNICKGVVYDFDEDDLEDLLEDADQYIVDYVQECHGSVLDFLEYHPEVFHVSKNNKVFPRRDGSRMLGYIGKTLPYKIEFT